MIPRFSRRMLLVALWSLILLVGTIASVFTVATLETPTIARRRLFSPRAPLILRPSNALKRYPTIAELLSEKSPALTNANTSRPWRVVLATPWFRSAHPYWNGRRHTCIGGCVIDLQQQYKSVEFYGALSTADLVAYHAHGEDMFVAGDRVLPAAHPRQRVAIFSAEVFAKAPLLLRPPRAANAELSFRPSSLFRDSYVPWFLNSREHPQGIPTQRPMRLDARVWGDLWEPPISFPERRSDGVLASWASGYCSGSGSGREAYIKSLLAAGLHAEILGGIGNCLRNAPLTLLVSPREFQAAAMRTTLFHLAFENQRCHGLVTEKFYFALLRGQVPVVFGAPDIARYAPAPESYIDVTDFETPAALVAHLQALAANASAYEALHKWRTTRSFEDYGDVLRDELIEVVALANSTADPAVWYGCRLCTALERARAGGLLESPPTSIEPFECLPPWDPRGPSKRHGGREADAAASASPLHAAARRDHLNVVNLLLASGATVDSRDAFGETPLHSAVTAGATASVEVLLRAGADVNARAANNATPLHFAAALHPDVSQTLVQMLINEGAAVNVVDNAGWTPLHVVAMRTDCGPTTQLLLNAGADGLALTRNGASPLDLAAPVGGAAEALRSSQAR